MATEAWYKTELDTAFPLPAGDTKAAQETVAKILADGDAIIAAPEAWREVGEAGQPAFENSWVNFHTDNNSAAFYKDSGSRVWLKGRLKDGAVDSRAFLLPSGYRPSKTNVFAVDSGAAHGRVFVGPGGAVVPMAPCVNTTVSLDGISFRV
jgi:hypothetical protein